MCGKKDKFNYELGIMKKQQRVKIRSRVLEMPVGFLEALGVDTKNNKELADICFRWYFKKSPHYKLLHYKVATVSKNFGYVKLIKITVEKLAYQPWKKIINV